MRFLWCLRAVGFLVFIIDLCAQWQPSVGAAGINMQSLISRNVYCYAGGASGAYRSANDAASFALSNAGNDQVGPTRGFASDVNFMYTCTSQGVFRSADNGATWLTKSVGLPSLLGSGILKVQSDLFVVGPVGVFRSSDQANSWAAAGLANTDVRCIAAIGNVIFVGTNGVGIFKSFDFGVTWLPANSGLTSVTFRAIEAKGTILFAGGQIGTGVFRSIDLGLNWTLLGGGLPVSSYRGFASNDRLIFAGSFGSGVYYSNDNGDHWLALNSGLTDLSIFDLEIHRGYLLAATNIQGVFRFPLSKLPFAEFGTGCAGSAGVPALASVGGSFPKLNTIFQLDISNLPAGPQVVFGVLGLSDTAWGTIPLPFDLSALGMPSCTQYISLDSTVLLLSSGVSVSWQIPIPAQSGIVGTSFFSQAILLDLGVNAFGAVVTNYGSANIIN